MQFSDCSTADFGPNWSVDQLYDQKIDKLFLSTIFCLIEHIFKLSSHLSRGTAVAAASEESLVDASHFKLVDVVPGSLVLVVVVEVAVLQDLLRLATRPPAPGSLCCGCC